jgi:hypothetical protein
MAVAGQVMGCVKVPSPCTAVAACRYPRDASEAESQGRSTCTTAVSRAWQHLRPRPRLTAPAKYLGARFSEITMSVV